MFFVGGAKRPADVGAVAGPGISKLRVKAGLLAGRVSDTVPILLLRRRFDASRHPAGDTLVRVEIQLRVTAGTKLSLAFDASESVDFDAQRSEIGRAHV